MCTRLKYISRPLSYEELSNGCRLRLDSHADISCVGQHSQIIEIVDGQLLTVHPFNDSYDSITGVITVNAVFTIDAI